MLVDCPWNVTFEKLTCHSVTEHNQTKHQHLSQRETLRALAATGLDLLPLMWIAKVFCCFWMLLVWLWSRPNHCDFDLSPSWLLLQASATLMARTVGDLLRDMMVGTSGHDCAICSYLHLACELILIPFDISCVGCSIDTHCSALCKHSCMHAIHMLHYFKSILLLFFDMAHECTVICKICK